MSWWRQFLERLSGRADRDLERELYAHLELETEDQQESGLPPDEARYAAQRALGNTTFVKEETRAMWGWSSLERLGQDLRYALRTLRKSPEFTAVAVLSLALGMGARPRLYAVLLGAFSALALLLSAVGLYGLIAYSASRRTHAIGVRIALGAQPREVLRSMLGEGARLAVAGMALGTIGAAVLSRVVANLLYGVTASDPLTYAGVTVLLAGVALIAAYLPARRAARVDPMVALRYE